MRTMLFALIGAGAGFVTIAAFIVVFQIGGDMMGVAILDLGLIVGVPIGGIAGAMLQFWLERRKHKVDRQSKSPAEPSRDSL